MSIKEPSPAIGCLLGVAVGDAIALPFEAMSKYRQCRLYRELDKHHFFFGRGMTSDDTEHTCMVAQALISSGGDAKKFQKDLSWRFRWWLLGLPASIGFATLRSILKLWIGFPSQRSGVFSAGNGPAMRSSIIGVCYGHVPEQLSELVRASSRITHTDPKAEFGALAVALAAHLSSKQSEGDISPQQFIQALEQILVPEAKEFLELIRNAALSVGAGKTTEAFAAELGLEKGVSGYVYDTVPVAIHSWLGHQMNYREGILGVIRCGGDTDTMAAIVGGIIGARVGRGGIPQEWLDGLWEWPRTVEWMEGLGQKLPNSSRTASRDPVSPLPCYGILLRNVFFLLVVLVHAIRRLLPPY